jgi:hypothetical protein
MITDDIEIAKKIFETLSSGILSEYDSFEFSSNVNKSFIENKLSIILNGIKSSAVETDFSDEILFELIENLKASSTQRGNDWKSFTMTYEKGGKVKTKFAY